MSDIKHQIQNKKGQIFVTVRSELLCCQHTYSNLIGQQRNQTNISFIFL